jgi:hypothetical protein
MNVTLERLQQIENEREQTITNKNFQEWFVEFNVSKSCQDITGILNARDMMRQYDYSKYNFITN